MLIKELNERANKVFLLDEGDIVISVESDNDSTKVRIYNEKTDLEWDYLPDMSNRPQALDYLMGRRNDFND